MQAPINFYWTEEDLKNLFESKCSNENHLILDPSNKKCFLEVKDYSLMVVHLNNSLFSFQELSDLANKKHSLLIGIKNEFTHDELIYNSSYFDNIEFLKMNEVDTNLNKIIDNTFEKLKNKLKQIQLLLETKTQNMELEDLRGGLEKIVAERTQDALKSKKEWEDKVFHTRGLVRFIKDLASVQTVEDMLSLIRKETKLFHNAYNPILFYQALEDKVVYFQAQQLRSSTVSEKWPKNIRLRVDDKEDQKYLANIFKRPVGRVISIPLIVNTVKDDSDSEPVLFFEHDLTMTEVDPFIHFLSERLQPLSTSLERIILEKELKSASFMWENTFDSLRDPISIINIDFDLLRSNSRFAAERVGLEEELSDSSKCYQVFANRNEVCKECPLSDNITNEQKISKVKRDDSIYEVRSYPIKFKNEVQPTTFVNHYLDITQSEELHGRLLQNEKMSAVGHLAGNIAHELNNPLSGIKSISQLMLSETTEGSTLHSDLIEIEKAAGRCHSIIKNLLDFSDESSSTVVEKISLKEVVEKTLPLLKTATRDFITDLNFTDKLDLVKIEKPLIQQVVFNLINNACQAMKEKGYLYISIEVDQKFVTLKVKDSGPGMTEEVKKNIFEPFYTTKKEGQGTGLGLSISHRIIKKHDGHIMVESDLGSGATFIVKLPRVH